MANAGITSAQMLPRFLLPQLSWRATLTHGQAVRALSTLGASYNYPLRLTDGASNRSIVRTNQRNTISRHSILENNILRRAFHATARQSKEHHFDTLKFVQRLQEEGFSEKQAVAMMRVLSDVIEERYCHHPTLAGGITLSLYQHPEPNPHNGPP